MDSQISTGSSESDCTTVTALSGGGSVAEPLAVYYGGGPNGGTVGVWPVSSPRNAMKDRVVGPFTRSPEVIAYCENIANAQALRAERDALLEALRGLLLDEDCAKGAELSTNVCRIYVKVDALDAARAAIAKATGAQPQDYRRAKGEIE